MFYVFRSLLVALDVVDVCFCVLPDVCFCVLPDCRMNSLTHETHPMSDSQPSIQALFHLQADAVLTFAAVLSFTRVTCCS
jgi:hypothetical protein